MSLTKTPLQISAAPTRGWYHPCWEPGIYQTYLQLCQQLPPSQEPLSSSVSIFLFPAFPQCQGRCREAMKGKGVNALGENLSDWGTEVGGSCLSLPSLSGVGSEVCSTQDFRTFPAVWSPGFPQKQPTNQHTLSKLFSLLCFILPSPSLVLWNHLPHKLTVISPVLVSDVGRNQGKTQGIL